jgi:hypothetical protein
LAPLHGVLQGFLQPFLQGAFAVAQGVAFLQPHFVVAQPELKTKPSENNATNRIERFIPLISSYKSLLSTIGAAAGRRKKAQQLHRPERVRKAVLSLI